MTLLGLPIAIGIAGLAGLAWFGRFPAVLVGILAVVHGALAAMEFQRNRAVRRRLEPLIDAVRSARPEVLALEDAEPPVGVAALIRRFEALGFRVVGATSTTVAVRPWHCWILVEASGEVWVEAGRARRAFALLLSETPAGRQVETVLRTGHRTETPELLAVTSRRPIPVGLADHRALVAAQARSEASSTGGANAGSQSARRVRAFEDYLAWEERQRARTGGQRITSFLRDGVAPAIVRWAVSLGLDAASLAAAALVAIT